MAIYTVITIVVYILLYLFSDLFYDDRYNLPIIILSIPLMQVAAEQIDKSLPKKCLFLFVMFNILNCVSMYQEKSMLDYTAEYRNISQFLIDEGYSAGYSTFWQGGNMLTELSDGSIDMYVWCDDPGDMALTNISDINQTNKWLQLVEHDSRIPSGKVFVLLSEGQYLNNNWNFKNHDIIYKTDAITILGYENYYEMIAHTQ